MVVSNFMPEIRFSNFKKKWTKFSFGEMYPEIRNGFVGTATPYYVENGIPYYQGKNIKNGRIDISELVHISDDFHNKQTKSQLKSNDILVVQSGHVGECAVVTKEHEGGNCHALIVMTPADNICSDFFMYYLYSPYGRRQIYRIKTGNTIEHILTSDLKPVLVATPEFKEQQKIASFLNSIDKKLNKLHRKRELLETYKRGAMQKIFSQELRFKKKGGGEFPDWEVKLISDIMQESRIIGDKGDKANKLTVKLWGKGVFEKRDNNSGSVNTQYYIRKSGQFIYSKLDFLNQAFGIVPEELDGHQSTVDLPCFDISDDVNHAFVLEYILQKRFYKKYGDTADGSRKAKRIHAETFLGFPIDLPCLEEQNKIAEFISTLDKKIEEISSHTAQLETFKKALLQKMFI